MKAEIGDPEAYVNDVLTPEGVVRHKRENEARIPGLAAEG